jgi:hypothetical protein
MVSHSMIVHTRRTAIVHSCRATLAGAAAVIATASKVALAAGAPAYSLDLVASPTDRTSIDPFLSINTTGTVAFVATDTADRFRKVFAAPTCGLPPCASTPISFFGSGREFNGASINNAIPSLILSADSDLGNYFLRSWQVASPGSFSIIGSSLARSKFVAFNGIHGLADSGAAVALALVAPSYQPSLAFFSGPSSLTNNFPFSSGTFLRPQIARQTGDVVATIPLGGGTETVVYQNPSQTLRYVAGASLGSSNLGANPAISDDGLAVAFYGTLSGNNQLFVKLGDQPANCTNPAADCIFANIVTERQESVVSLAAAAAGIVGVFSRRAGTFQDTLGLSHYYQLVTVAFPATISNASAQAVPGVYSRDLLIEGRTPVGSSRKVTLRVVGKGQILPVVVQGSQVDGATLAGGFIVGGVLASAANGDSTKTAKDSDLQVPWIAVAATDASNSQYIVRGLRQCAVPGSSSLGTYKQVTNYWSADTVGHGTQPMSKFGCLVTDATNILGFFEPQIARTSNSGLTPGNVNTILAGQGFAVIGSGKIVFPGPDHVLGGFKPETGLLIPAGVEQLSRLLGNPIDGFEEQVAVASDDTKYKFNSTGALVGATPAVDPNVNGEDLSPITDFFLCNQQPVTQAVVNCTSPTSCHEHFVVDWAKSQETPKNRAGQSTPSTTYLINDPGYANSSPTNLIDVFKNGAKMLDRRNRVVGVRAYSNLLAGKGNDRFSIVSTTNVSILLTDPKGRQIGINPATRIGVNTIPNASYVLTNLSDPLGVQFGYSDIEIIVGSPLTADGVKVGAGDGALDGDYTLGVTGIATGSYSLTYVDIDAKGNVHAGSVTKETVPGQRDSYPFVRNPSGSTIP